MAKGIQDIGNGLGYLYMVDVTGAIIQATQPNTVSGVQNMRQQGTSTAPIVANRPAVGKITVNSVASLGSITAISIYGINQIDSSIAVTTSTASVVAGLIAARVNSFAASPVNFTAQAVDNVVYLFSPANAQPGYPNYNGAPITVTATSPTIQTTTEPTSNGSTEFSNSYDSVFGFRFYIDADYGPTGIPGSVPATPTSLLYALEITEYFTVRGMQSGIVSVNNTIASDRVIGLNRSCAFTQIIVDTQASAATDVIAFIQTEGFVEGDEIRLRNTSPSRIPVVEDATVSTSPIATKNIYLINQSPFSITGYLSINLQLRNDPTLGFVWIETGRSEVAQGFISVTIAQLNSLAAANNLKPNSLYYISDLGDNGTYTTAISISEISTNGQLYRRIPKNYTECWQSTLAVAALNSYYRYYNSVYRNITGAVAIGVDPAADTVNWVLVPKTNNSYYGTDVHNVIINQYPGLGISTTFPILSESDNNGNIVSQSEAYYNTTFIVAYDYFQWQLSSASPTVYNNIVIDSIFEIGNFNGNVFNNTIKDNSQFILNTNQSGANLTNVTMSQAAAITLSSINNINAVNIVGSTLSGNTNLNLTFSSIVNSTANTNTSGTYVNLDLIESTVTNNSNCTLGKLSGKLQIIGNTNASIENVTGINNLIATNQIQNNLNVKIIDVTGSIFFINSNQNITIQLVVVFNGYINLNVNTVPANKLNCGVFEVSLNNESKITGNTWNTNGFFLSGTITNGGEIRDVLIDTSVNVSIGTVYGSPTVARQNLNLTYVMSNFTIDGIPISGSNLTKAMYTTVPIVPFVSGIIYGGFSIRPETSSAYSFIDASTAISGTTLNVPIWAAHAGILYFYNCNGQNITEIVSSAGYRFPIKIIRLSGTGQLTITPTLAASAIGNQIVSGGGAVILNRLNDYVEVIRQGITFTLTDSAVVL